MSVAAQTQNTLAFDTRPLDRLKHTVSEKADGGVKETARQFEAMFLRQMLSTMRESMPESDLLDSSSMDTYRRMQDAQLSEQLAGQGFGLAEKVAESLTSHGSQSVAGVAQADIQPLKPSRALDTIESQRRLAQADPKQTTDMPPMVDTDRAGPAIKLSAPEPSVKSSDVADHVADFVARFDGPAKSAAAKTGLSRELILAQAALETGWGRHESQTENGEATHNVFNIKASSSWQGGQTDVATHEYVAGKRVATTDGFRVYETYAQAFDDYARLITKNDRYAPATNAASDRVAADALQAGGYATDPAYADKIVSIAASMPGAENTAPRQFANQSTPVVDLGAQRASLL